MSTSKESTPKKSAPEDELIDFGVKIIKDGLDELSKLIHPAKGATVWYNDTDRTISVKTYDEDDAVRWVSYEKRKIAPKQVVNLTARGEKIHVLVENNGCTYDCVKGQAYLFDGNNVHPKKN
jgi:hypothetical protein